MSIKVTNDANNGTVTIKGAEVAGDYTVTTPAFSTELAPRMKLMTAQNSTSGTSIDFTGIPSWAKKITVMFNGVSTNGTSIVQIQAGDSGGLKTSGYLGATQDSTSTLLHSSGFAQALDSSTTYVRHGMITLVSFGSNVYVANGITGHSDGNRCPRLAGSITLSGTLDRIRITTVNGTDTFDAGQIGVLYEG